MRNILLLFFSLSLLSCAEDISQRKDLRNYLTKDAAIILKLQDPDLFFSHLKNNGFLKNNNSHPLAEEIRSKLSFLDHFENKSSAFLSFSTLDSGKISYTFVQQGLPEPIRLDSVKNRSVETLKSELGQIRKYNLEGQVTYTTSIDSIYLVSDSQQQLEALLSRDDKNSLPYLNDFRKALKASSDEKPVVLINHKETSGVLAELLPLAQLQQSENFSNWTSLDIESTQSGIKLNGVSTASDSLSKFINLFKNVAPAPNELSKITPVNSDGFFSFTFEDFTQLQQNLESYNKSKPTPPSAELNLLTNSTEAGVLYNKDNTIFVIRSYNIDAAKSAFSSEGQLAEEFHGIKIYTYSGTEDFQMLAPLVSPENLNYFLFLDDFILFSSEASPLKEVVISFQNENTLVSSEAYLSTFQSLSTESSLLWVSNNQNFKERLAENVSEKNREATAQLDFKQYPIAAIQFIYQDNFAHVHAVLERSEAALKAQGNQQLASITLDDQLAAPPVFFKNHRTNGLDIAVQDIQNTLYLISAEGKIYWKKELDGRIIGEIQQVDLYRNGRIQLAFATPFSVQVIDRDGNKVKPFPLSFRDEITQPLSVFDYDNNRKYRFLVVQNEDVFMYDGRGRSVGGFKFRKASSNILLPPKHIRIGQKDYIVIPEASGKLNILSRTGKPRVNVRETFSFSENEWYEYENNFISTNEAGQFLKVDQQGNIIRENLNLAENHRITATPKTLVSLSENELSIKGKSISLDYGLYTEPQIFYIDNKIYVSVTDTQSHRVFLFDSTAELLPGFPVYGNSPIDLGDADGGTKIELLVKGDDDSVLLYEIGK